MVSQIWSIGVAAMFVAGVGGVCNVAWALPRFALQEAESCSHCHVNPSGLGMRNRYGAEIFATRELAAAPSKALATALTDSIRIGGDMRSQAYAHSDDVDGTRETTGGFFNMQGDLYLNWDLGGHLSVYIEQDVFRGTVEAFGMYAPKGHEGYVKLGGFLPNYGLRIDDHTAFVRGGNPRSLVDDGLFWEPNYADAGVEVGVELAEIEWTAGVYNGGTTATDVNRDKDVAVLLRGETRAELGSLRAMIGLNAYSDKSLVVDERMLLAGAFVGLGTQVWTLMAEVDLADAYLASATDESVGAQSLAVFSEGTIRVRKGLHVVGRYEYFDPDVDVESGKFWRASVGLEYFPRPYMEIKPMLRHTDQPNGQPDLGELLAQTHWWF